MQKFQGIVFTWTQTYREIFQICISVPLKAFEPQTRFIYVYKIVAELLPKKMNQVKALKAHYGFIS